MAEEKKSNRLGWTLNDNNMVVSFPDETKITFEFTDMVGWKDSAMAKPIFEIFRHGLKQKLADTVAGMTKNGVAYPDQAKVMEEKWEEIRTGVSRPRANAKIDPLAEARKKLEAMPEGAEKVAAMNLAKVLGIIK
ncbi:MAG: hypothetical protein UU74_C0033G0008 [Candidatus Woesebacteria bacterium GW2011_GWA1_41_7]|uniref:Uncharacterized protein n=1 Tax=Candidatus Woesebacteria bacterium GW2011_GWA1_41_7 TaxID=1618556 RepID=A0A0G0Z3Y4_9BACT|nr:MAG: hypothetical protein UU74_C0033G0008 [Candidatus Woesebacteria bacterium GW2011_GWA1_41_7]